MDVLYADLVHDPLAVVRGIYDRFGYAWSARFEAAPRTWIASDARSRRPTHGYSLDQFGLDAGQVEGEFAAYRARFGIPEEK